MSSKAKIKTSKEKISKVIEQAIQEKHNESNDLTTDLFSSLDFNANGHITKHDLIDALKNIGILEDDPRIAETIQGLKKYHDTQDISHEEFKEVTRSNSTIIEKALKGHLVVPCFKDFCDEIDKIYEDVKSNKGGAVADYIPQLKRVDPNRFGVSICTIDGQRYNVGECETPYCVQSTCKPINYCFAMEENGEKKVHSHVGREPSGRGFNELTLNNDNLPHNPMINSGAIMCSSLIKPQEVIADRFDHVLAKWKDLSGGRSPGFNNSVYLSEKATADRNFALGYFMKEKNAFPENTDLEETLQFYFQCCSIEVTAEAHANVAATLANSGICPITDKKLLEPNTAKNCLSLMYSCGMYDFSGEFAFSVGLPAKSGVSGALVIVIPNVMGIVVWAPPLDVHGNSVKGIDFCQRLVEKFNFHNFDDLIQTALKTDPRHEKYDDILNSVNSLCLAASQGDLNEVKRLHATGINLDGADYDGRTAIHLAASDGHEHVIKYFIESGININPKDRWGGTPLSDAMSTKNKAVIDLLKKHGGTQ